LEGIVPLKPGTCVTMAVSGAEIVSTMLR